MSESSETVSDDIQSRLHAHNSDLAVTANTAEQSPNYLITVYTPDRTTYIKIKQVETHSGTAFSCEVFDNDDPHQPTHSMLKDSSFIASTVDKLCEKISQYC